MTSKTEREIIQEIYTMLLGVPYTEDNGCIGDIKEIKEHLAKQNGKIAKNRLCIIGLACLLIGMGILDVATLLNIFGG